MTPDAWGDAGAALDFLKRAAFGYVATDGEGKITEINDALLAWLGYGRDELVGRRLRELITPKSYDQWAHRDPDHRRRGSATGEVVYVRKDGSTFVGLWSANMAPRSDANPGSARFIVFNVAEQTKTHTPDDVLRDRLIAAVESVQQPFAIFNDDDVLVMCNAAFRSSFEGALRSQVVGRTFRDIFEVAARDGLFELGDETADNLTARRLAHRERAEGPFECRTADGRSWRFLDRRTAEGLRVTTIWDFTADAERERELALANKAAEAASEAKSQFLASMSHELRTPLNAIVGFAQLLSVDQRNPLDQRQQGWLKYLVKSSEHLLNLINEVLDLAYVESGSVPISPEAIDVAELIAEIGMTLTPLAERSKVALAVTEVSADVPPLLADRTRARQILLNFGSNAIKYNRAGGEARISATPIGDGLLRLTVSDTGVGIPSEKQHLLFEPFQRLGQEAGSIEGTGIGLVQTKRLARLMGGDVGFRSESGRGSEFWIDLPAAPRALSSTSAPRAEARAWDEAGAGVLLYIEDNAANIALMEAMLADASQFRLLTAPTAELGLELARAHRPALIILDINLPGTTGYEVLARLRAMPEGRDVPVIALSASAMERDRRRALAAGFARFLAKPVKVEELIATLAEVLQTAPASPAP